MPCAAASRRGRQRACLHQRHLRPGLPGSRRHPGAPRRRGQEARKHNMSDDLDGWGGADFVLAADRLDTPDVIEAADPADMLRQVASAAAQVRTALRSCAETDLSAFTPDARPRAIVVAGMGGSGLAGEMLNAMTGLSSPVQVVACQAERLPGWVGAADAVIAVSCSGTTPETLAIAAEAARRGCRLAGVGTEGSPLHRIAEQARAPFVPVVPAGLPRSMLWALAIPLLVIADRLGVTRVGPDVYELAATRLEEVSHQCRPASESFVNPGKSLALDLIGALPMVWGTSVLSRAAKTRARRWRARMTWPRSVACPAGTWSTRRPSRPAASPRCDWCSSPIPVRTRRSGRSGRRSPSSPGSVGWGCPSSPWTASIRWCGWPASSS